MKAAARPLLPFLVLAVALAGVSFGSIFVRLAVAPALAIALWRMTFASLVAVPAALGSGATPGPDRLRDACFAAAAGGLLALHFGTWITSLQFTTIANSVLLVNTAPVFVALFSWAWGARPAPGTWLAALLAVAGAAIIASGGDESDGSLLGNALAVVGAIAMAGYLLLARAAQRGLAYLPYVAIAYGTAALVLWVAVLVSGTAWSGFPPGTWAVLAAMAVVSQLIGHGGYNWSLRHLQPAFVAVALTGEPVVASGLAWWLLGEPLTARTVLGGSVVLAAIAIAARSGDS